MNLAASMRGPTRVGKRGKTPVLMLNKDAVNSLDQHQCEHPHDRYTQGGRLDVGGELGYCYTAASLLLPRSCV